MWPGGVATETPLERVDLPEKSSNHHTAGYAATLQLPLEGGLVGALSFVIHAPAGRWVACNRNNSREDFFFNLAPVSACPPQMYELKKCADPKCLTSFCADVPCLSGKKGRRAGPGNTREEGLGMVVDALLQ